jgi:hypothetical protein
MSKILILFLIIPERFVTIKHFFFYSKLFISQKIYLLFIMEYTFSRETLLRLSKEQFNEILINLRDKMSKFYREHNYHKAEMFDLEFQHAEKIFNERFTKKITEYMK